MKTKTCVFAILLATGLINSHAQDTWTQKADFGGTVRYGAVGFSIGSKGYIGTGDYNNILYKDSGNITPLLIPGHRRLISQPCVSEPPVLPLEIRAT